MSAFEFVLIILAMSFGYGLLRDYLKRRARRESSVSPEVVERLALLEDRVRVLERIVTDRGDALRREFETLRDR
jgi:hypothetical protein